MFRKPELIPSLALAAAIMLMAGLGIWQVERLQWKNALIANVAQAQSLPPLSALPKTLEGLDYRNVELHGSFINGKFLRLAGGVQGEGPGFFIVTPFKLARDGRVILVNRGFAPSGKENVLSGTQTVKGVLRPLRQKRFFSPSNYPDKNIWFYEDKNAMAQFTGLDLLPLIVEQTGKRQPNVYPIPNKGKIALRNDHLGYAITWFSLAAIAIVMFGIYYRAGKIRYISTRGEAPALSFEEVVLAGLASDGGLYVPDRIPTFTAAQIAAMKGLSYPELAFTIISRFADIEPGALKKIIDESYKQFRDPDIAPLYKLDDKTYVLELFHGPTLAFKDFALQFLGRLLDHILQKRHEKIAIVGATSGDTGSAAIEGCRGRANMDIFILHPKGRVSDVQRKQMTTVLDGNVHNIALEGTFDDCQNMVKTLFGDKAFREQYHLTAVNSINWARIVAQIPYYFYAALKLGSPAQKVSFSVPTGNFGDIYAGHIAKKMGLPIDQLIIATNSNDILRRCLTTGTYGMDGVKHSLSPSMDIEVSSNFERLLFDLYNHDAKAVVQLMTDLKQQKYFTLSATAHAQFKNEFASASANDEKTLQTISETYTQSHYLLDPHSAVGLAAGKQQQSDTPLVVLATAHPAKFPDAVKQATGIHPPLLDHLKDLFDREERYVTINNPSEVKHYIMDSLAQ